MHHMAGCHGWHDSVKGARERDCHLTASIMQSSGRAYLSGWLSIIRTLARRPLTPLATPLAPLSHALRRISKCHALLRLVGVGAGLCKTKAGR
jgi:hypothetical protein